MDFLESIFSIVPLLMIVLFFVRLAALSKKKNKPKPVNTIDPAEKTAQKAAPPPEAAGISNQNYYPSSSQSLNSLDKIKNNRPPEKIFRKTKASRERLNSLPELKKAVIWSEILGKPKGLD